eukprot:735416-Prymnesium_polylepis.1
MRSQPVPAGPRRSQPVPAGPSWSQLVPAGPSRSQPVPRPVPNGPHHPSGSAMHPCPHCYVLCVSARLRPPMI